MNRFVKYLLFVSFFFLSDEDVETNIKRILPAGFEINFIERSEIPNLYVVNVLNNQILYVSDDYNYVFAGDLIGTKNNNVISINNKYKEKFTREIISTIKPNESIDFVAKDEIFKIKEIGRAHV